MISESTFNSALDTAYNQGLEDAMQIVRQNQAYDWFCAAAALEQVLESLENIKKKQP